MELKIIKRYGTTDAEFVGDHNTELWFGPLCIIEGDEYHDNISTYIEGYIDGLRSGGLLVEVTEEQRADMPEWD